jgi:cyclopropane fatty-acyl-phospholipid synthase-like methyltransferase
MSKIADTPNWWYNLDCPESFSIQKIDNIYDEEYYKWPENHIRLDDPKLLINHILKYLEQFYPIKSILEFSVGCGEFTRELVNSGYEVIAIDGVKNCFKILTEREIKPTNIILHDLRLPIKLQAKYDIALAMEIAEHIEPPFASTFISNITSNTNLVYFTFVEKGNPHIHHPNIKPFKYWNNLFEFFNFTLEKKFNIPQYEDRQRLQGYLFKRKT